MLVFWKQKLVILAVPKTGTTALAAALGPSADIVINDPPELKHAPLFRYNRFFRPMFEKACKEDGMETLAIMREPVDWLGSWYRYRQRDFLLGKPTSTRDISFDDFVREYCKEDRKPFANVGSQAKFLEPRPNGTKINHLFRYDDHPSMLAFLAERLGRDITLGQHNVSPQMALTLSDTVRAELEEKRAAEFALYRSIG
ncbi:gamma-glutamyl kinase [Cognatishimia sp. SS12]|uniref:gamma-glutamyl kinase n=1 Tax=Cognatishimia sp. SS12 TaxID=2979465 RepID=UPI00232B1ABD|nr:gamma-glutamyl kinase [Cognatishimia sp. SS12]MDC0737272.1 gamma-glutamyl kinase [Cognatishimia sp. SS12]